MTSNELSDFINQFELATKKPEKYLSIQDEEAEKIKHLTKNLYGFTKSKELPTKQSEALNELIITNLDEEQIWQQIDLQNNSIYNKFVDNLAHLLAKKENLKFPLKKKCSEKNVNVNGSNEIESQSDSDKDVENGFHRNDSFSSESEDNKTEKKKQKVSSKKPVKSIVDDKFFKLHEMEEFLEEMEKENNVQNDDDLNYFFDESSKSDDEEAEDQPRYNDFFDQPADEINTKKKKRPLSDSVNETKGKKVKFALNDTNEHDENFISDESNFYASDNKKGDSENESEDIGNLDDSDSDFESEKDGNTKDINEPPSTFEARQERLKSRISNLEESALKEKPWQMKGEITANSRPQNSLLQEYVEFDVASRPAPILTEKSTMKLEDVIKQRIKDRAWDDVVRKIKPIESEMEYKKKLVLDQEKSKLSLAQIYEKDYLKQVENKASENISDKPEVEPPEHQEIKEMLKNLFTKLDALSNFHFTPKPVSAEVKIVSNLPALAMEEVAPIATSEAALLAPEEVKAKPKGDLIGKSERSATDKKRERRKKKVKQRMKFKKLEDLAKLKLEDVKSKSVQDKKISNSLLQKLTKSSAVTSVKETGGKYVRSSTAFFSKLQDQTSGKLNKARLDFNKSGSSKKVKKKKVK